MQLATLISKTVLGIIPGGSITRNWYGFEWVVCCGVVTVCIVLLPIWLFSGIDVFFAMISTVWFIYL
jgi:hypothetical protein